MTQTPSTLAVKAYASDFFEWPTSDKSTVSYTSCLLFAEYVADEIKGEFTEYFKHHSDIIDVTNATLAAAEQENAILKAAITKTLSENGHLADGDNCTLIDLKRAIGMDKKLEKWLFAPADGRCPVGVNVMVEVICADGYRPKLLGETKFFAGGWDWNKSNPESALRDSDILGWRPCNAPDEFFEGKEFFTTG